jgi:hypothetical protein
MAVSDLKLSLTLTFSPNDSISPQTLLYLLFTSYVYFIDLDPVFYSSPVADIIPI